MKALSILFLFIILGFNAKSKEYQILIAHIKSGSIQTDGSITFYKVIAEIKTINDRTIWLLSCKNHGHNKAEVPEQDLKISNGPNKFDIKNANQLLKYATSKISINEIQGTHLIKNEGKDYKVVWEKSSKKRFKISVSRINI